MIKQKFLKNEICYQACNRGLLSVIMCNTYIHRNIKISLKQCKYVNLKWVGQH